MNTKLTFIHALSPLHAGTGQGVGAIDLPIAREKATGIPYLPGSSVKGTLRDEFNADDPAGKEIQKAIFGPEDAEFAGAIQFSDQTLLCLPVRSISGLFAYVTSPYLLQRLKRDAGLDCTYAIPSVPDEKCLVTSDSALRVGASGTVILEDLDLEFEDGEAIWAEWIKEKVFGDSAWQDAFADRFCIVSDNMMAFLLNTSTEVTARIKIEDETKTAQQGALWYEEALPTESILFGLAHCFPNVKTQLGRRESTEPENVDERIFAKLDNKITRKGSPRPLQFGGNATVGRGLCELRFADIVVQTVSAATGGTP